MPRKGTTTPVVEGPAHKGPLPTSEQALKSRLRQQEILAALGVTALKGTPFEQLLEEAVHLSTEGLHAEFGKVLEFIPSEDRFVMRAGSGWDKELVGKATVGADLESPAGYALRTGKPVISNHLEREQRFRTPGLLAAHGVRARSTSSCKETVGPMAFLKWIASLVANSASTISRSCKAPLISWEWQSSDNDASVLWWRRSTINRHWSKRSIIESRTACSWSRAYSDFRCRTILRSCRETAFWRSFLFGICRRPVAAPMRWPSWKGGIAPPPIPGLAEG
jgi:hypothetical protein